MRQILGGTVGHAVGPAHGAIAGAGGRIGHARHQAAAQRATVFRHRGRVHINQIDIIEGDGAAVAQGRCGGILGHIAGRDRRTDGWRIVGAGNGHGDQLVHGATLAVTDGHGKGLGRGLIFRQILGGAVGHAVCPADGTVTCSGSRISDCRY